MANYFFNQEQVGSWKYIDIILLNEISTSPAVLTNSNTQKFTYQKSPNSLDIHPVAENISVKVTEKETSDGLTYDVNISFDLPGQSSELDSYLHLHDKMRVVCVGVKQDGSKRIFGSKNFPLNFSYREAHGKKLEDLNVTRVSVKGTTFQRPVYLV